MRILTLVLILGLLSTFSFPGNVSAQDPTARAATTAPEQENLSDAQIRQILRNSSIEKYLKHNHCPCKESIAKDGSICGKRSAYTRPNGYCPLCYDKDVTPAMIAQYRKDRTQPPEKCPRQQ